VTEAKMSLIVVFCRFLPLVQTTTQA
jgi:hypothetical protein